MKKITLSKADPITNKEPVDSIVIEIAGQLPEFLGDLKECKNFYDNQADLLFNIMINHLPQGTRHALLIKMLQYDPIYYRGK